MTDADAPRDPIRARHAHACTVAREAGAAALDYFDTRATLAIEAKANPQDVVSRADREVETLIRDAITAAFPDDAILGEEAAPRPGTSGFTWVMASSSSSSPRSWAEAS